MIGCRWVVVSLVTIAAVATVTIVVTYYLITDTLSHPHEQTARYLPPDTQFYLSVNLRPGVDQLSKIKKIYDRFKTDEKFGEAIDDLFDQIEDDSRIDVREDVLPWLGPEIAIALVDFDISTESAEIVGFFGTTDPEDTSRFLDRFLDYLEKEGETKFAEGSYKRYVKFDK